MRIAAVLLLLGATVSAQPAPEARGVRQPTVLAGRPFPQVTPFVLPAVEPSRTFYASTAVTHGDGSAGNPWNDLQRAVCALRPGDRLNVAKGAYAGDIVIDGSCLNGSASAPIELAFDEGATIGDLSLRRSHWRISGASPKTIRIERASFVLVDRARLAGGTTGVTVRAGASDLILSNSVLTGMRTAVEIEGGAKGVAVRNNRVARVSGDAIRVRDANDVRITGNTIREVGATALFVDGARTVVIDANTLQQSGSSGESTAIAVLQSSRVTVRMNEIENHSVGISIGRAGSDLRAATDILVARNHLTSEASGGSAVVVEAGSNVRVANNTLEGHLDGILLLGRHPSLTSVTVANNLLLGVSRTAFAIEDSTVTSLFDYNLITPASSALQVEMRGKPLTLTSFLAGGTMPHTRVSRVAILNRDLSMLSGLDAIDQGIAVTGVTFEGKSPDLGVSEQ